MVRSVLKAWRVLSEPPPESKSEAGLGSRAMVEQLIINLTSGRHTPRDFKEITTQTHTTSLMSSNSLPSLQNTPETGLLHVCCSSTLVCVLYVCLYLVNLSQALFLEGKIFSNTTTLRVFI